MRTSIIECFYNWLQGSCRGTWRKCSWRYSNIFIW